MYIMNKENKKFSIVARVRSANHAWRGLGIFDQNHSQHLGAYFLWITCYILRLCFRDFSTEWLFLVFAIGFVLVSEAMNTAFEIDII